MPFEKYKIHLTEGQKKKLIDASNNNSPVKLKLTNAQLKKEGNMPILLTKTQIDRIVKSSYGGKGMILSMSVTQMRENKKQGGIIPFLIPIVIAGASALATGALSALGGIAVNKIASAIDKKKGGNVMMQGLAPSIRPNDISSMPIGGQYSLKIGGCCECGRMLGEGLYPIGIRTNRGSGIFPVGVKARGSGLAPAGSSSSRN